MANLPFFGRFWPIFFKKKIENFLHLPTSLIPVRLNAFEKCGCSGTRRIGYRATTKKLHNFVIAAQHI